MSLLKAVILPDVVEIVSADHNRPLHLLALDDPSQDAPPNAHITGERTLLVNVRTFTRLYEYSKDIVLGYAGLQLRVGWGILAGISPSLGN